MKIYQRSVGLLCPRFAAAPLDYLLKVVFYF